MKRHSAFTLIELLIVVAIIAILAAIAVPNFLEAQIRARVSRAQGDMRSLAVAIESYRVDSNAYPVAIRPLAVSDSAYGYDSNNNYINPVVTPNSALIPDSFTALGGLRLRPTFCLSQGINSLTTPVAYITSYPDDPFAQTKGATFEYVNMDNKVWFVASYGPDDDEMGASSSYGGGQMEMGGNIGDGTKNGGTCWGRIRYTEPGNASSRAWNGPLCSTIPAKNSYGGIYYNYCPQFPRVNDNLLVGGYTYDPSNGSKSDGDIWRLKQ